MQSIIIERGTFEMLNINNLLSLNARVINNNDRSLFHQYILILIVVKVYFIVLREVVTRVLK